MGECSLGTDTSNAVSCVSPTSQTTAVVSFGKTCGTNEWYVGTRTPVFGNTIAVTDTGGSDDTYPFRSDFSWQTMNKIAYLSVVGTTISTRQMKVSVFARESTAPESEHTLVGFMDPRANYFDRLDYYGSAKNTSIYPVASIVNDWNAVDVMLSYDDSSIYIFFSYTFDFIGKCRIPSGFTQQPIPAASCSYLSTKQFVPTATDAGISGTSFTYKGCTRMIPMHYLACLYDLQGAGSILYGVDELRDGGEKLILDSYDEAFITTGQAVGRPKSPPAWDPATKRIYYMIDLNSGQNMGIRYVGVNATFSSATGAWTVYKGSVSGGILWRGVGSDSSNYHSLVFMRSGVHVSLTAACSPPNCPPQLSTVSFTGTFSLSTDRTVMPFPNSSLARSMRVRWGLAAGADYSIGESYYGQQLYVLSKEDRLWGMWTQCAQCPINSFSPSGSSLSTPGINSCKCSSNFYGLLRRPVVDACSRCRIQFDMPDLKVVSESSALTSCDPGQYKTNAPCNSVSPDRSIDTTCAQCFQSCRPGDVQTKFPGEIRLPLITIITCSVLGCNGLRCVINIILSHAHQIITSPT